MKSCNFIKSAVGLLSASLLVCSNALEMEHTYRQGSVKNIAFNAFMGGSSHHTWVLSIMDSLGQRGHNMSYLTTTEDTRFGHPYTNVKTVDIGPVFSYNKASLSSDISKSGKSMIDIFVKVTEMMALDYERDYHTLLDYFETNKIDVVLCDYFMAACVDAANTFKIPFIVTSATDSTTESAAPYINNGMLVMEDYTTELQGFFKRFKNKFILPLEISYKFGPYIKDMSARRKAIGIKTEFKLLEKSWDDSIKLINNMFAYTPARPIGPMAEFVGPIIPKKYKPLTPDLADYLNSHQHVAYIAFGQMAVPSKQNIQLILTGLLESIEAGSLDGFLWATVNSAKYFPETITTPSGIIYQVQDMLDHVNPHARMIKWAPQTAVLLHPSTFLFVSHGGLGSWYESMYAGTPMIMFPFFGDQLGNALMIERNGLGGVLKADASVQEAVDLFKKITEDKNGEIKANVKRVQALTQIRSENGVMRGSDVVEEVIYTHKGSKLPHRQTVDRHMSYGKSRNLDLYAALVSIIALELILVAVIGYKAYKYLAGEFRKEQKVKDL